jgi:tetratricopeptide (TPR) repeat protein
VLETVRQYGAERLVAMGRSDALRRAHAVYFAVFAEALPITGSEQARALARLDVERDNLRAAIDSAILLGDPVLERRITGDLWRYWQVRGFLAEGAARLEATVGQGPNVAPEFYAQAVVGAGNLAWAMGRYEDGKRHGHELLRLAEASGALRTAYVGNRLLAAIALRERDFETSERYSTRAVELIREVGAPMEIAMAEMNYAVLLMDWGQIDTSIELYRGVLGRFEALGSREGVGLTRLNLGEAAFLQGRDGDARAQFEAAREAFTSIGFRAHVGHATQGLAAVEARSGDAGVAANFLGRADAILTEVGASADDFNPRMVADAAAAARTVLGDEAYAAAFDAGWRAERSHSPG